MNEEIVKNSRKEVGDISSKMLDGSCDYLEGSRELIRLRFDADLENDHDMRIFIGIVSETDNLPIGNVRGKWSQDALKLNEPEIKKAVEWAKSISLEECKSLSERFNA
ncbi:MAG: hypothetical protein OQJ89_09445 [Kangiellaceae bacterium]|nr:hypothetical protein [Kangiellaceae bacterium]MCW9017177.1 hypothetical protein [Kangiellaceae bacterium]